MDENLPNLFLPGHLTKYLPFIATCLVDLNKTKARSQSLIIILVRLSRRNNSTTNTLHAKTKYCTNRTRMQDFIQQQLPASLLEKVGKQRDQRIWKVSFISLAEFY